VSGVNAYLKVPALVGAMVAGADSIQSPTPICCSTAGWTAPPSAWSRRRWR